MRQLAILVVIALLASSATAVSPAKTAVVTDRTPGSVLVFPVHRSGTGLVTIVSITNTNLEAVDSSTKLHFEYVNTTVTGNDPLRPSQCVVFDRIESLTPADTLSVSTKCHNAFAFDGQDGYLVVSAQDPMQWNTPWAFDHLVGSEFVVSATGVSYGIPAIALKAETAPRSETDINGNGRLDFDGLEYETLPDVLYVSTFAAFSCASITLINLTGGDDDVNTVLFSVFNDNEFPLSTTLEFNCWFDRRLEEIDPLFTRDFMLTLPNDIGEIDTDCDEEGEAESGWVLVQSLGVAMPGGGFVSEDGAILGSTTGGPLAVMEGGRLLWESTETQDNGVFLQP